MTYCELKLISKQTGSSENIEFLFQIILKVGLLFTKGYLELYSMSDEIDVMSGWRKTWGMGEVKQSLFLPTYTAFGPISKPIQ